MTALEQQSEALWCVLYSNRADSTVSQLLYEQDNAVNAVPFR